jgi:hypothetical protein
MYVGYIQFLLIIFVFIRSLGENLFTELVFSYSIISIPILLLVFISLSLLLGYFDSKLGIREEEIRNHSKSNPVLTNIQERLDSLDYKIELLSEKLDEVNVKERKQEDSKALL